MLDVCTPLATTSSWDGATTVSEDDWKTAAEGTYTANSRKIYTNGHVLRIGGQVYDPQDGATYTVRGDLDHGVIHPLRRFVADRKGEAASK